MRTTLPFFLTLAATLASCSRSVPREFPRASAASGEAAEAAPARVGLAIAEEPPLPGDPRPGWESLDAEADEGAGHHGHHGHQGHHGHGGHGDAH